MLRRFLLGALVLSLASFAVAGVPDLNASTATIDPSAIGAMVYVVPNGSGLGLNQAYAPGGGFVDATITLMLIDTAGDPIFLYPAEDLWLQTSGGGLSVCENGANADAPTDINGETQFQNPLNAGGNSFGETTQVVVAGAALAGGGYDLLFNSADINGDLQVNLSDVTAFTQMLSAYNWEGDFNYDSVINLADVTRFTQAIGVSCN
jgi:hypothetical protein